MKRNRAMNRILAVGGATAVLFLFLGITAPVYGQEDQQKQEDKGKDEKKQEANPKQEAKPTHQQAQRPQQEAKPAQQQARQPKQEAKPAQQQAQRSEQHARPQQQQARYVVPQRTQQQARSWQQQRGWLQQGGGWQGHATWQADGSSQWQTQHRTWAQRGGYGGYYIPQSLFSVDFGPGHWFRIRTEPVIVLGYPQFQYSGYTFMLVDPWPEAWAQNWYANDDVYITYDNGYYLHNRAHPDFAVAVSVVL